MMELFKSIFVRAWKLIVSVSEAWKEIATEYPTEKEIRRSYVFPLISLCLALVLIFGTLYAPERKLETGFLQLVIAMVSIWGGYFIVCIACFAYINKLFPNTYLREDCTKVVSYCYTIIIALKIITTIIPSLFFIKILCVFVGYMLWEACEYIFKIPEDERTAIVVGLTLIIIVTSPILSKIMQFMLPNVAL